jgi:hypothetical protein
MAGEAVGANPYGSLVGGGVGAIVGAIGGYLEQKAANTEISRTKAKIRGGVLTGMAESARSTAGIMTTPEWLTATNFVRSFYGIKGVDAAELRGRVTDEYGTQAMEGITGGKGNTGYRYLNQGKHGDLLSANEVLSDESFNEAASKIGSTPGGMPMDVLSAEFQKQINQSLSSRGLNASAIGGAAEASGLAGLRANMQMQMLPALFNIAEAPAALRAKYEHSHLTRGVFYTTGGVAAYGQGMGSALMQGSTAGAALSGAVAGFAAGSGAGGAISQGFANRQQQAGLDQARARQQLAAPDASIDPVYGSLFGPAWQPPNTRPYSGV